MDKAKENSGAAYYALRAELVEILWGQRCKGHFRAAMEGMEAEREALIASLTHSIVDILVAACCTKTSSTYRPAFVDAEMIAS